MSKLFEALQKIEQQNQEAPFSPADTVVTKRSIRPTTIILLILLLLFIMGGVVLVFLNNQGAFFHHGKLSSLAGGSTPGRKTDTIHTLAEKRKKGPTEKVTAIKKQDATDDFYEPSGLVIGSAATVTDADKTQQVTRQKPGSSVTTAKQLSSEKQSSEKSSKNKNSENKKTFTVKINPVIQLQQRREEKNKPVQQLLYQAEARRREGDMEAAVTLYRRAWKLQKSPATANNLAAGLIVLKKYKEARDILQKALDIAPDDADLQYNLKITKERLAF